MIALLRGVNVGGRNLLPMAELRLLLGQLGLRNVRTLLQSGNVVFDAEDDVRESLARAIEDAIESSFGFRPLVILRSEAELRKLVDRNPFRSRSEVPGNRLLVMFCESPPKNTGQDYAPAEVHCVGREIFLYFPNGVGQSRFAFAGFEKRIGTRGTARNWNTVRKLLVPA